MDEDISYDAKQLQIFAAGGGGFTHPNNGWPDDSLIEDALISTVGLASQVRIGFFGHASNDDEEKIKSFYKRFEKCKEACHLPLTASATAAKSFLSKIDILYVGGGATNEMLEHWRKTGIDKALKEAATTGLVLSGVSAGAVCWFDELLLTTNDCEFGFFKGLGVLQGSACPHFNNEPLRKKAFEEHILKGRIAAGVAIDDGVAVHIIDGYVSQVITSRKDGSLAYFVDKEHGKLTLHPLLVGQKLG